MALNIAMDGPVGAGKSTIADEVAKRLDLIHLDTGAMYRAVGLTALRRGVDIADEEAVTKLCGEITMEVVYGPQGQRILVNGLDITGGLHTEEVSMAASKVATYGGVRKAMVATQQRMAATTDMLLDGRDIGTRVLPNATVKIFLTADAQERARRRFDQLKQKGIEADFNEVLADLKKRDEQDMNRAIDPLKAAPDAVIVDSTGLSFEETVESIVELVKERAHG
ncbi:MAG: (d)CMP kinase [Christensenellaceae bacterium]|nr:(d)CMP kinase [Christensenellaceae bacterium]